jgi:D-glycero-D-manno-heptose 1,7-bisphosphate phosphatase
LPVDEIRTCYHDDADQCSCRKPAPGMLLEAALTHDLDLSASFMVGDRWRDVEAGFGAGCRTVFLDRGYRERRQVRAKWSGLCQRRLPGFSPALRLTR